ncbi:MAG: hypothetical protein FJX74_05575 [Armatimonadetes bacterium]|nr:hypothetical protein [Armatimonadota bacterium]
MVCCGLALLLVVGPLTADPATLGRVQYTTPEGWAAAEEGGAVILAPPESEDAAPLAAVLYPASELGEATFRAWFDAGVTEALAEGVRVVEEAPVEAHEGNGLSLLTVVRSVQDAEGAGRVLLFHALSDGDWAAMLMVVGPDGEALAQHMEALQALIASLDFVGRTPPGPVAQPPPTAPGEPAPVAGLVDGRPQGLFVGVSVLSGRPAALLFMPDGRAYHGFPPGGLNAVDWARLRAEKGDLCGAWTCDGGVLRIQWNDGNVWEGPLEPTETGMRFMGKAYGAARPADLQHLTGTWEGTNSTLWLNLGSGPSVTQINRFQVSADGSYRWDAQTSASLEDVSAAGESSAAGKVEIDRLEVVFRAADGSASRLTLARWDDPSILILGGSFYFRQ